MKTISKQYASNDLQVARYAKALSHPARVAILTFLSSLDTCFFGDILDELPISKATVSQHLKELKEVGLIQGTIEAPKVKYCIHPENWETAQGLLQDFFKRFQPAADNCCL